MSNALQAKEPVHARQIKREESNLPRPERPFGLFALFILLLSLCFFKPLVDLVRLAAKSDLYSHALLVPGISLYLVWLQRASLPKPGGRTPWALTMVMLLLGVSSLAAYFLGKINGFKFHQNDYLALTIFGYLCFAVAGGLLFLGIGLMRSVRFPTTFLLFMVPLPTVMIHGLEIFFQYTSAFAAQSLFVVSGTPLLRQEMTFQLPGLVIRVAEECSGIRSSLVLFITGLLAGHLFLRSPWRRAALAVAVIPLGIVRNAFRIFTIAMLCMHVDPGMIDSPLHHRGGPIFFGLSLIPFFILLLWLWKSERKRRPSNLAVQEIARPGGNTPAATGHAVRNDSA